MNGVLYPLGFTRVSCQLRAPSRAFSFLMRSGCLDGAALVIPATAWAVAEVVRKSRREGLMAKRYEIALGSQAEIAMTAGRRARLPREAHVTFHHAAAEGETVAR